MATKVKRKTFHRTVEIAILVEVATETDGRNTGPEFVVDGDIMDEDGVRNQFGEGVVDQMIQETLRDGEEAEY